MIPVAVETNGLMILVKSIEGDLPQLKVLVRETLSIAKNYADDPASIEYKSQDIKNQLELAHEKTSAFNKRIDVVTKANTNMDENVLARVLSLEEIILNLLKDINSHRKAILTLLPSYSNVGSRGQNN